jgi:hypothetical protein
VPADRELERLQQKRRGADEQSPPKQEPNRTKSVESKDHANADAETSGSVATLKSTSGQAKLRLMFYTLLKQQMQHLLL